MALYFIKTWVPINQECFNLCQVWLKLVQWFWRRRWKCEKFTDRRTTRDQISSLELSVQVSWKVSNTKYNIYWNGLLCYQIWNFSYNWSKTSHRKICAGKLLLNDTQKWQRVRTKRITLVAYIVFKLWMHDLYNTTSVRLFSI